MAAASIDDVRKAREEAERRLEDLKARIPEAIAMTAEDIDDCFNALSDVPRAHLSQRLSEITGEGIGRRRKVRG